MLFISVLILMIQPQQDFISVIFGEPIALLLSAVATPPAALSEIGFGLPARRYAD
jgi:hypothetical protein